MTMQQLASMIAKREGKKHQASIGDIREILKIYYDLSSDDEYSEEICDLDNREASRRSKAKKKKKR